MKKKLIIGGLAALAIGLGVAAPASADYYSANERQFIRELYSAGIEAQSGADSVGGGYWVCDILGNHSGGYVASQVWLYSDGEISYSQANTIVYAAIANLCPWRWY